jgi:hypothetical protein
MALALTGQPCEPMAFDGMALSPGVIRGLATVAGLRISQCRWRYGDIALRQQPFLPHLDQAGNYTTPDGRTGDGFDGYGWYPGDHKGCLCRLVPIFTKI